VTIESPRSERELAATSEHRAAAVVAPSLGLTVTIEPGDGAPDIHIHPGGQGFWSARLLAKFELDVTVVGPVGGEAGDALAATLSRIVPFKRVTVTASSGAYVHDRRSGDRAVVADMPSEPLARHDIDELYGAALVCVLAADVGVLPGPGSPPVVTPDFYRRLTADLHRHGIPGVADVAGPFVDAVLEGGTTVLKASAEDLGRDGRIRPDDLSDVVSYARRLVERGTRAAVITRAHEGAIVRPRRQL
jgi:1-phosphofructokinase